MRGGAGDDSITLTDLNFAEVDGGHGDDTLVLGGSDLTLDLTGARTDVESFEIIDLTGTGNNTLVIDALSLLDLSGDIADGVTTLDVIGTTGDKVTLEDLGWAAGGQVTEGGVTFNTFTTGNAVIRVQDGVSVERPAQVLDLSDISTAEGITIQGDKGGDRAGGSVSSAGDVNGDGFEDLIVGARAGDQAGWSVSSAGDVNGDGFEDLIVGARAGDQAGWSVSSAGDVNGDGFEDLIVARLVSLTARMARMPERPTSSMAARGWPLSICPI